MAVVFGASDARRIARTVKAVEAMGELRGPSPKNHKRVWHGGHSDPPHRNFFARITAVEEMVGHDSRWVYDIEEVRPIIMTMDNGVPTLVNVEPVANGRTGKALNIAEMANQNNTGIAFGVDRAGADYPAGFAPRPVSGGGTNNTHKIGVPVWVLFSTTFDEDEETTHRIYFFDRQGHHDGTCEAPE